jgi:hypothetical protein
MINVLMVLGVAASTILAKVMEDRVKIPVEVLQQSECCHQMLSGLNLSQVFGYPLMGDSVRVKLFLVTEFRHPLLMTMLMFLGELILLPIGYALSYSQDRTESAPDERAGYGRLCMINLIPASFDLFVSFLTFTGLSLLPASTF